MYILAEIFSSTKLYPKSKKFQVIYYFNYDWNLIYNNQILFFQILYTPHIVVLSSRINYSLLISIILIENYDMNVEADSGDCNWYCNIG